MQKELFNFFIENNKSGYKLTEKWLRINEPVLYDNIINEFKDYEIPFKEKVWLYVNEIHEPPQCPECDKNLKLGRGFKEGFPKYCSTRCSNKSEETKEKKRVTYKEKDLNEIEKIKEKRIKTNTEKYGVDNPFKLKEFQEKQKETIRNLYGVDNVFKLNEIKEKCRKSNINKTFIRHNETLNQDIRTDIKEPSLLIEEIFNFIKENTNLIVTKDKDVDILITEKNVGVDYINLYQNSNKYLNKNYHSLKTDLCNKNGITLLHVFEDEWRDKKNIVKSIIRNKLGFSTKKIYARKTKIKEVSSDISVKFLNENHIQGSVGSKVKIGLYYDDELVSLMTFGKKRVAMGSKTSNSDEYEMLRFCNKINHSVIGGASKLLSYFEKNYKPKSILSFADRRYSEGNLYKKLGFDFIEKTEPNYFYFEKHKGVRRHRFKYRKDVLVKEGYDPNMSEREIMEMRGYLRIYDCGQLKFQKNY
jgi:hypothetical protein